MKFYIGSGLQNCGLVNSYAEKLEENGWRRTYDWTKQVGDSKTTDELTEIAEAEQKGVRDVYFYAPLPRRRFARKIS